MDCLRGPVQITHLPLLNFFKMLFIIISFHFYIPGWRVFVSVLMILLVEIHVKGFL